MAVGGVGVVGGELHSKGGSVVQDLSMTEGPAQVPRGRTLTTSVGSLIM